MSDIGSSPQGTTALVSFTLLAAALLLSARSVLAVDGVIEINQARALEGGVTPTDAPGFPVTVDRSGSYRLTSDLDVRGQTNPQHRTGIQITADDVTIDLNGFAILGPADCRPCAVTGSGSGVKTDLGQHHNVSVADGTVRGMGAAGVALSGQDNRVERVRAIGNGAEGIRVGTIGVVSGCIAHSNEGDGIFADTASLVIANVAASNGGAGLRLGLSNLAIAYAQNVLSLNVGVAVDGGTQIGTNLCGTTTCP